MLQIKLFIFLLTCVIFKHSIAQNIVSGYVYNEESYPINGAFIINKNTLAKTKSNQYGYFEIPASPEDVISIINSKYEKQEIIFHNEKHLNIFLNRTPVLIKEIILYPKLTKNLNKDLAYIKNKNDYTHINIEINNYIKKHPLVIENPKRFNNQGYITLFDIHGDSIIGYLIQKIFNKE